MDRIGKVPWLVALELTAAKRLGDTGKYRIDTLKFFVFSAKFLPAHASTRQRKFLSFACRRRRRYLAITIARQTPLQPSLVYCNWPGPPMYHRACPRPRLATGKLALSPSHRQSPHDDIYSIYTISGTSYFTPGFALENALKWTSDGPVTLQLLNILHKLLKGSR